jgi:hypothetical protein
MDKPILANIGINPTTDECTIVIIPTNNKKIQNTI